MVMDWRLVCYFTLAALAGCQSVADRSMTAGEFPVYRNAGKPDLTIDTRRFAGKMNIVERRFGPEDCAVQEGGVGATGDRRLLRFDTVVLNAGDGDLVVGDRAAADNAYRPLFEYATCHGHYHIRGFSEYDLLRAEDRSVVVKGRKLGFCFRDSEDYRGEGGWRYNCGNQGITSGWADVYGRDLDGQWIDITGVPPGNYIVRVTINASGSFDEGEDRYPNVAEAPVHVSEPAPQFVSTLSLP